MPQPGDLIEIFRGAFEHWVLYIGDGDVVHLVPQGSMSTRATVRREKLKEVAKRNCWKVNNSLDKKYRPRPVERIVKEACSLVGTERNYDLIDRNCERFVTDLRYGKAESRQVPKAIVSGLGLSACTGAGLCMLAAANPVSAVVLGGVVIVSTCKLACSSSSSCSS